MKNRKHGFSRNVVLAFNRPTAFTFPRSHEKIWQNSNCVESDITYILVRSRQPMIGLLWAAFPTRFSWSRSYLDILKRIQSQQVHIQNQKKQIEDLRANVESIQSTLAVIRKTLRLDYGDTVEKKLIAQILQDEDAQSHDPRYSISAEKNDHSSHLLTPEFLTLYQHALQKSKMQENPDRRARFYHLIQLLRLTKGILGSTAEAGVFRGCSSLMICEMLRKEDPAFDGQTHFMLDSFQGLSAPVEKDGDFPATRHSEGAFTNTSVELVQATLSDYPNVNILQGWIPPVLQELPEQQYRFVHIDVDVYEPTLACLQYFFPRLSAGGAILCDDYGPWRDGKWLGCLKAVQEFSLEIGQEFFVLDSGNVFFIKR